MVAPTRMRPTISPAARSRQGRIRPEHDAIPERGGRSTAAEGAASVDLAKRKQAYFQMQEITRRDLPYLPIFQYAMVSGVKKG